MSKSPASAVIISEADVKAKAFQRVPRVNLKNEKGDPFIELWELDQEGTNPFSDSWWYGLVPRDYAPVRAYKNGRLVTVNCSIGRTDISSEDIPWNMSDWQAINPSDPLPWVPDSRVDVPVVWSGQGGVAEKHFPGSIQILQNGVMMAGYYLETGAGNFGDSTFVEGHFSVSYVASA